MVKSIRSLPFTERKFLEDVKSFFGCSVTDMQNFMKTIGSFDAYMTKLVDKKRINGKLTYKDMLDIYSDNVYVYDNVIRSPHIITLPSDDIRIETEFLKGVEHQIHMPINGKVRALDHGCGTGFYGFVLWMYGYEVTFCDLPTPFFKFLKKRCEGISDIHFIDVEETLKLNEQYDFIFSFFVMEHLLDPIGILNILSKHLEQNGIFYLRHDFAGSGLHLSENKCFHSKNPNVKCSSERWWDELKKAGLIQHSLNKSSNEFKGPGFLTKDNNA